MDGELPEVIALGPSYRIARVGDPDSDGVPDHFGKVESRPAEIGAREKNSATTGSRFVA